MEEHVSRLREVRKRNGSTAPFDRDRIANAIFGAAVEVGGSDRALAERLADRVVAVLEFHADDTRPPAVEEIQDVVEKVLIKCGHAKTAKAFILHRKRREETRDASAYLDRVAGVIDGYVNRDNWRVNENSNTSYAVSGLQAHIAGALIAEYTLNGVYPPDIAEAHRSADLHIHDLSYGVFAGYCAGWSLKTLLRHGLSGVPGRIAARPARHFNAALGQAVSFFGTLQNEWAGAQAFNSFDTHLAPFVRHDGLTYDQVKQAMQEFVFSINQTSRWGNQVPFTNVTFDWVCPEDMRDQPSMIGGEATGAPYGDHQREMDMINRAFIETMMAGDADGRIFTFPIPTYNLTRDFDWDSENAQALFEMTAKYGIPYFQNFINSTLSPGDVRSMCCRLQLDMRKLRSKTGGLFGSGEQTGSIGVVTINLPRIGYLEKREDAFFARLSRLMELGKRSLEIKRKEVKKNMAAGLLPYTKRYLGTLNNHFSTIGLTGMHECCLNFLGRGIETPEGRTFTMRVLDFMRERLADFQEETGHIYNLEATPAEGTSYRLAKHDRERYPDIRTSGSDTPYYTNSTQLPVGHTDDIFEALEHQDELQARYSGGTVLHGFLGERVTDWRTARTLVRRIAETYRLPYFTLTPTFSVCPVHGYLSGEHKHCPYDHTPEELERLGVEIAPDPRTSPNPNYHSDPLMDSLSAAAEEQEHVA